MTRLRLAPYRDLKKVAEAAGFKWLRCEGSHNVFRNLSGRIVIIPTMVPRSSLGPCFAKFFGTWA